MGIIPYVILAIVFLLAVITAWLSFFTVNQQTVEVIERFGKFIRVAQPGLNFKIPWVDRVARRLTLRVQQLDVNIETKTKDNVFVKLVISVQYMVLPDKVYDAAYRLNNTKDQITAYVFDVVRAQVPELVLDRVFEEKEKIASAVKNELAATMDEFGYGIMKALVTDIDPDPRVKESMNKINAAQRDRAAAEEEGEADKIRKVKAAEAEAESKALQGKGIADQRKAIVDGLRESVQDFQDGVEGTSPQEVLQLVLLTQYFDTMKDIGAASKTSTVFMPHSPGALGDLMTQIQSSLLASDSVTTPKE